MPLLKLEKAFHIHSFYVIFLRITEMITVRVYNYK